MDNAHTSTAQENVPLGKETGIHQAFLTILSLPFRLFLAVASYVQPFAPQIIPVLVCISFIPLAILLSFAAGFFVWKNVAVSWETPLYLQYGDGASPYALTPLPPLVVGQYYGISLQLIIPSTESNFALGNFMTTLTLTTASNKTITSIRRPTIAFPSGTFFFRPKSSTITLNIPMMASFVPGSSKINAYVEVGRHDGWKSLGSGQGKEIAIISASVRGSVAHHGLWGIVTRFPLTFSMLSATAFLMILTLILAACILPTIMPRASHGSNEEQVENNSSVFPPPSSSGSDGDGPALRRHKVRVRRSRSKKTRIKTKVPVALTPSMDVKPDLLRRRQLRASDGLAD